jgi:hypothetical protein
MKTFPSSLPDIAFSFNPVMSSLMTLLATALVHDLRGNGIPRGILTALDVFRYQCDVGQLAGCAVGPSRRFKFIIFKIHHSSRE